MTVYEKTATLGPGRHAFSWFPEPTIAPRTYLTLLDVTDASNNRRTYGASNAETGRRPTAPVIRVLGVDAGFTRESYVPGETATLRVETDANALSLQVFRAGPEDVPTYNDTLMNGVPMTEPVNVVWSSPDRPGVVSVPIGAWASGVYFARLTADDGRIGFAPFVLRPAQLGATRVAVIIPTNTWQAYNFRDEDGNGWGNTWYAKGAGSTVKLGRPFLRRGVPPQYRKYDLGFLRWLAQRGKQPDYLTETDLEVLNGDTLAGRYDLVIFGGHTEYVTPREFDAIERYRDLGGNLMFLSADNFFWQVQRRGDVLSRTRKWRDLGRPESALLGVQYRANDNGRLQRPFIVRAADTVPWLFAGTDLSNGASLGQELGGYGIEIDMTTAGKPAGDDGAGGDTRPLRAGIHGADDVLRDPGRSEGLRRRRDRLRRHCAAARRLAHAREPLGPPRPCAWQQFHHHPRLPFAPWPLESRAPASCFRREAPCSRSRWPAALRSRAASTRWLRWP